MHELAEEAGVGADDYGYARHDDGAFEVDASADDGDDEEVHENVSADEGEVPDDGAADDASRGAASHVQVVVAHDALAPSPFRGVPVHDAAPGPSSLALFLDACPFPNPLPYALAPRFP